MAVPNGLNPTFGGPVTSMSNVAAEKTRETSTTGSFQTISGDLTYEGAAGGTSTYHAGVMGNFLGDALTNTNPSIHAGVIGSYNVTTSDALTGPKAGVVGEVGDLAAGADAAFIAVLGGDSGALTPGAAYGVRCLNSTAASKFNYGLDLFGSAIGSYQPVTYGKSDIRLSGGVSATESLIIASGSAANDAAIVAQVGADANVADGSLYLSTASGGAVFMKVSDVWVAITHA